MLNVSCPPLGDFPGGVLLHSVLDDGPALGRRPLHPLHRPGHPHLPGGPVIRATHRSRVHIVTGEGLCWLHFWY